MKSCELDFDQHFFFIYSMKIPIVREIFQKLSGRFRHYRHEFAVRHP